MPGKCERCGYILVLIAQVVSRDISTREISGSVSASCRYFRIFMRPCDFLMWASGAWQSQTCCASSNLLQRGHSSVQECPHSMSLEFTPQWPEMCFAIQCHGVILSSFIASLVAFQLTCRHTSVKGILPLRTHH